MRNLTALQLLTILVLLTALAAPVLASSGASPVITQQSKSIPKSNVKAKNINGLYQLSFESGNFSTDWQNDKWTFTTETSSDGQTSIKSEHGKLTWNVNVPPGYLSFDVKGDGSHFKGQPFVVNFNNREVIDSFSHPDWHTFSLNITESITSITFEKPYVFFNEGPIYIDNIRFIPLNHDNDNDQMPDQWELENGLDYHQASDANLDPDEDGLTNYQEYFRGTLPNYYDSDGDDVNDSQDKAPLDPEVQ